MKRYGIYYMHDTRAIDYRRFSSRAGFNDDLTAAIGRACWHIGMDNYYPKAVIVDRSEMKIVRIVHRTSSGISIVERK
jgi:hypothetical protein